MVKQNASIPSNGIGNRGGNTSTVLQGAGVNDADVTQDGLFGTSSLVQRNGGTATIDQNGNGQDGVVDQDTASTANVTQNGGTNEGSRSFIAQRNGADGIVTVIQYGDTNTATVSQ